MPLELEAEKSGQSPLQPLTKTKSTNSNLYPPLADQLAVYPSK